ncbi:MAG TPA: alpha-L-fucosidase [Candidatus Hydrogenedentes bacterium]|nr:alpha-L-fucosidase [Candidatus Hydrogenedentota bacterium]HOK89091.1 alpha-L-fucosidase [Candidatus Hydrogenedentota bacterium]
MTLAMALALTVTTLAQPYQPTWESLDKRPNPQWFEDAKFGIFIHWGVYSVPSWGPKGKYSEWYWHDMQDPNGETWKFHVKTYGEKFKYQDFAPMFKAELYDPNQWADVFARSGAKYVVCTSKHHEGFSMWPDPNNWNWNAMDIGPHRDLLGELVEAVRARGLRMGFYYSFYEWFNPLYRSDVHRYVDQYMLPQMKDLVTRYKPDIFWPDGEWEHPSKVWRSTEFLAWLFNESPAPKDIAINDRWGKDCRDRHGGFATPEYEFREKNGLLTGKGLFEECQGMGRSFGYNRNETPDEYRSATELLHLLIGTVARGGNLLLDIGPGADGRIPDIMQERLLEMGQWLQVNGDAIYATDRWADAPEMEHVKFTRKGDSFYAICLQWPGRNLSIPNTLGAKEAAAVMLGMEGDLAVSVTGDRIDITMPDVNPGNMPCLHAWCVKVTPKGGKPLR